MDAPEVVRHLGEETFTSYDRDQMLAATREIEDRAYRVGEGTLRAGFQTVDRLRDERERYDSLADRGLDVTVYAVPGDDGRPAIPDVDVRTPETDEIADHWFVAFRGDGAGGEAQHSALLAEQRPNGFYGIWTYDPAIVDRLHAHLRERYDRAATGA